MNTLNKDEVRKYWQHKERMAILKVICASLIGTAILVLGCGDSAVNNNTVPLNDTNNKVKSTGSVVAKRVGGNATVILPDNQKLQLVTWKEDDMWLLYRPMRADEQAETYTYQEDSRFGILEANITIREVKTKGVQ